MTFDLSRNSGNIVVTDWGTVIQHDPQFFICIKAYIRIVPHVRRFFFIYAILRDRITTLYDRNTCVNLSFINIDIQDLQTQQLYLYQK